MFNNHVIANSQQNPCFGKMLDKAHFSCRRLCWKSDKIWWKYLMPNSRAADRGYHAPSSGIKPHAYFIVLCGLNFRKNYVNRKKIWDTWCLPAVCCYDNRKPLATSWVCLYHKDNKCLNVSNIMAIMNCS